MNKFSKLVAGSSTSAMLLLTTATSVLAQYDDAYTTTYDGGSDAAGAAFGLGMMAVWCCILLIVPAFWIGVSYWVYKDATSRGNDSAVLWAILTFFLGIIGLLIYLLTQRDNTKQTQPSVESVSNNEEANTGATDTSSTPS